MAGLHRALVLLLAIAATGCVPIPYKPSASVNHVAVTAEEASAIRVESGSHRAFVQALTTSVRQAEPRIAVIDGSPYLASLSSGQVTLAQVLRPEDPTGAVPSADYILAVGNPVHRQLHDTGAAAPFILFPVIWVGYEKVQSRESVVASLIDLHSHSADRLEVSSIYSEVIAAAVYGVGTIARPQAALRDALATDVAHRLAALQPSGPIRIMVLAQDGGTSEAEPDRGTGSPQQAAADAHGVRH
jgi:hypothetical protein